MILLILFYIHFFLFKASICIVKNATNDSLHDDMNILALFMARNSYTCL